LISKTLKRKISFFVLGQLLIPKDLAENFSLGRFRQVLSELDYLGHPIGGWFLFAEINDFLVGRLLRIRFI
jgi:hypothetical protein